MRGYADREDAGRQLARALQKYRGLDVLVLALPRGGVPVAAPVADALDAELDVIVARKLGAPGNPEFGVGAIAADLSPPVGRETPGSAERGGIAPGARFVDERTVQMLRLERRDIDAIEARERQELTRRQMRYRGARPPPRIEGRVVILVDDGIATGATAHAAILSIHAQRPARLVLAVPVAPPESVQALGALVDEVVCPLQPADLAAVGQWYDEFGQTSDDEVLVALAKPRPREVAVGRTRGSLSVPEGARGLVVFAHGSGSSRWSPRNRAVARTFQQAGLGTLLVDLLTSEEEARDERTREHRFDIGLLARRLAEATRWAREAVGLPIAYFGSSTGAAAALVAAADDPYVAAVVSRGGRPDLAGDALPRVRASTLLLVGGADEDVLDLNRAAQARMRCETRLDVVPGATHLFEEPGALDEVARRAADWLGAHFR